MGFMGIFYRQVLPAGGRLNLHVDYSPFRGHMHTFARSFGLMAAPPLDAEGREVAPDYFDVLGVDVSDICVFFRPCPACVPFIDG